MSPRERAILQVPETELRSNAIHQITPIFPPLPPKTVGKVGVKVLLDENGHLLQVSVYGNPKDFNKPEFTIPAEHAIRGWKFKPIREPERRKVRVSGEITFPLNRNQ